MRYKGFVMLFSYTSEEEIFTKENYNQSACGDTRTHTLCGNDR